MSAVPSIAASGMRHGATMMVAAASNFASVLSDEYRAAQVSAESAPGGGVRSVIRIEAATGVVVSDSFSGRVRELSGVNLEHALVSQRIAVFTYVANAAVIRAESDAVGSLLDRRV